MYNEYVLVILDKTSWTYGIMFDTILILDGYSEHVAHLRGKTGLFLKINFNVDTAVDPNSQQMP